MAVLNGNGNGFKIGPCEFEKEAILLPNGLRLNYFELKGVYGTEFGTEWTFLYGGEPKKLYGGKILENITQALARIHTMDAALRIQRNMPLAMQVHDELVYVVPDDLVEWAKELLYKEMTAPPSWAPDLPLDADVGEGDTYGDCK